MALATRCPHCDAMFRVVADQLKLRGGLVRCGQCRTVFDAIGSLSYVEDAALTRDAPAPAALERPTAPADAPPAGTAAGTNEAEDARVAAEQVDTDFDAAVTSAVLDSDPQPAALPSADVPVDEPAAQDMARPDPPAAIAPDTPHANAETAASAVAPAAVAPDPADRWREQRRHRRSHQHCSLRREREPTSPATAVAPVTLAPPPGEQAAIDAAIAAAIERAAAGPLTPRASKWTSAAPPEPAAIDAVQDAGGPDAGSWRATGTGLEATGAGPDAASGSVAASATAAASEHVAAGPSDAVAEPEFVLAAQRPPRRGFSLVFGGGSVLLALLLVVQGAVAWRSDLLARWPALRPALVKACVPLGCTVGWPTRVDQLAVVGSELQAIPGTDVLELTAVVRNRAAFRQALPALEVTLTDARNQALVRRVVSPADYLAAAGEPSVRIDEGIAPGADQTIRIHLEARGVQPAGFLIYPFFL